MANTQKLLENTNNAVWKHLGFSGCLPPSGHEVEVSNTVFSWESVNNTDFIETENIFLLYKMARMPGSKLLRKFMFKNWLKRWKFLTWLGKWYWNCTLAINNSTKWILERKMVVKNMTNIKTPKIKLKRRYAVHGIC